MARPVLHDVKYQPDLTPLLDVVFQLMTFFIMVSNFNQEVYDQRVRLPVAGSARPIVDATEDKLVLNIDPEGRLLFNNQALGTEQAIKEIRYQADLARLNADAAGVPISAGEPLPTTIILRADRETPFTEVFALVRACQDVGFTRFDLRALSGPAL
ncbi:ExbD/TolR family protein [Tautonia sociabilis]|uniref:Biopolymer transporter ExbD n=1 Tax=Tautonia sociabilis TaxID=2080755 RepID=A0A432MJN9_9BACT|nr:biopolymer transporter ExbD [Tautonia sociabilis]RUL87611.1 biopolymer transporter ExbD [Tautonia sociabilis]